VILTRNGTIWYSRLLSTAAPLFLECGDFSSSANPIVGAVFRW
ncbi:unnamed protein product, partial [Acanthoscelides obtectus]